ncbi:MAG: tRNA (adenosine(37)-N6)-threonylcarbamoyltransferase complex dimerization subunit type 1 TsaB, partial [Alicyclobacillus herbarius]|uniref:tRNA (adenosine(37)-N6)-threonylcarbamoyltransferase complex dimerization subunit type 1 TsaB n=1 Tax=Alicyclobacillus herbarius TaxID=122960 RepID=UPI002354E8CB
MVVLTMDSATDALSVGLGCIDGGKAEVWTTATSLVPRGHSRLLQPLVMDVCTHAGVKPCAIEAIAVGVGPGSYTGVRLAVSTAKAMALALNIPVRTISTLAALAEAACPDVGVSRWLAMPLLYARRKRAFGAVYAKQAGKWTALYPEQVQPVVEWADRLKTAVADAEAGASGSKPECLVVDDFRESHHVLPDLMQAPVHVRVPLRDAAGGLGTALLRLAAAGYGQWRSGDEVHEIEPMYGLAVEAEVKLEEAK